ncbi:hypothetical protein [Methylomagnum ishizawai]|uniref:hypothetical protein n=1 Tax=Methylomagnum ishizawai TaxID=1760988 RepID=UPI001C32FAF4|nr:hypothetical protein [Methylomagnum ishizawai]BBL74213.1 hypothetical protein MishRS11D_13110 [Methylomagnum ishizawai]
MKQIGIDDNTHHVYEASNGPWCAVWPSPMLSIAAFVDSNGPFSALENDLSRAQHAFREDTFDAVTRIRRGRFYRSSNDPRPSQKYVLLHPVYGAIGGKTSVLNNGAHTLLDGKVERRLFIFDQEQHPPSKKIVMIGSSESLWRVIGAERIVTGEYMVTLKARHALGILPELNADAIPKDGRQKAIETYEKLIDSAYRETPGSIIDRARDAAQWCLGTWLANQHGDPSLLCDDLGRLIKRLDHGKQIMSSAASIIARLHSRGKPNEQERYSIEAPMEADAEFALAAIGMLLRELKWTM